MLNCLHYLGAHSSPDWQASLIHLEKEVAFKIESISHISKALGKNKERFKDIIIPAFRKVRQKIDEEQYDNTSEKGAIIYKSYLGYCIVKEVSKVNEFILVRPGFMWDRKLEDFVGYAQNEVYRPIKLDSYTQIII